MQGETINQGTHPKKATWRDVGEAARDLFQPFHMANKMWKNGMVRRNHPVSVLADYTTYVLVPFVVDGAVVYAIYKVAPKVQELYQAAQNLL